MAGALILSFVCGVMIATMVSARSPATQARGDGWR